MYTTYLPHADTTGRKLIVVLYLLFLYFASIVGFALVHHSNCQIFLDVDSNVDVGTDDSEEGICIKNKKTLTLECMTAAK